MTYACHHTPSATVENVNQQIRRQAEVYFRRCERASPQAIERRLRELDEEWDIGRVIESESASMVLLGLLLGTTVSRKWLAVPLMASTMLLLHNTQGWYPLLPLLRRLGFRTAAEIDCERYALKGRCPPVPIFRR